MHTDIHIHTHLTHILSNFEGFSANLGSLSKFPIGRKWDELKENFPLLGGLHKQFTLFYFPDLSQLSRLLLLFV